MYKALFGMGVLKQIIRMLPACIPAVPSPAIARPTINIANVGATPLKRLPSSKKNNVRR
jgi:hypothetical protein